MSIYIGTDTRIIVQGITGFQGSFHMRLMAEYGSCIVAGTSPGKGGSTLDGIPVFDTVAEAKEATGANATIVFVPPAFAADAICEAADAELDICVCITEDIPVLDMVRVKTYLSGKKMRLIGPNCPGMITPDACKMGIMPNDIHLKGHIGVVSRSGSLTYETIKQLTRAGIGQSTSIGIGGDPVNGTSFLDAVQAFAEDDDTYGIVMIGEIGGNGEQAAAQWIKANTHKPVVAFIGGRTSPPGKRMGHAGAVISGKSGSAQDKIEALTQCGIRVAPMSDLIADTLIEALKEHGLYEKSLTVKVSPNKE